MTDYSDLVRRLRIEAASYTGGTAVLLEAAVSAIEALQERAERAEAALMTEADCEELGRILFGPSATGGSPQAAAAANRLRAIEDRLAAIEARLPTAGQRPLTEAECNDWIGREAEKQAEWERQMAGEQPSEGEEGQPNKEKWPGFP